jgi:hypothetical protein
MFPCFCSNQISSIMTKTICDTVCEWFAAGRWFSPVSSTNKTDCQDITEILMKVALNWQQGLPLVGLTRERLLWMWYVICVCIINYSHFNHNHYHNNHLTIWGLVLGLWVLWSWYWKFDWNRNKETFYEGQLFRSFLQILSSNG